MKNEPPQPATTDGADPSMEEILASIRRILNDDEVPAAPKGVDEAPAEAEDVLILDQTMMVTPAEPTPDVPHREPPPDLAEPEPEPEPYVAETKPPSPPIVGVPRQEMEPITYTAQEDPRGLPPPTPDLVAPEAAAAAASSVGNLMRTLAAGRATQVYAGGPTLEDIVRAELRPLLKEWLDANLPPMVERLVRAEIERVVGRVVP